MRNRSKLFNSEKQKGNPWIKIRVFWSMYLSTSFLKNLSFCAWHICLCTRQTLLLGTTWVLQLTGSPVPLATATNLSRRPLHFSLSFVPFSFFLLLHLRLGYSLFNYGIFIKLSINQILQYLKNIIWYKKLSSGINICSYLIGSFQKILEEISTHIIWV